MLHQPDALAPAAPDLTPAAPYRPTAADLDELGRVSAIHDVLDLVPDLPREVRWGLLDHAHALLGKAGPPPSGEPRGEAGEFAALTVVGRLALGEAEARRHG